MDMVDGLRVNDLRAAMNYNICMVFCRPLVDLSRRERRSDPAAIFPASHSFKRLVTFQRTSPLPPASPRIPTQSEHPREC